MIDRAPSCPATTAGPTTPTLVRRLARSVEADHGVVYGLARHLWGLLSALVTIVPVAGEAQRRILGGRTDSTHEGPHATRGHGAQSSGNPRALACASRPGVSGGRRPVMFTYAFTKRMLFVGQLALRKQFGLRSLCVVPSTLYGPGYHAGGRQMHFIFDLIRKIIRGKRYGDPVILWGDGFQRREIIFVDDFVAALQALLGRTDEMLVNIGAGSELTIREYAAMISAHIGFDFERIQFDTSRYVGAESKCLDITRLNRILPARPQTPLREGLRRTIEWFLSASGAVATT